MNNSGNHESNVIVKKEAVDKRPPGFFQRLSAVLTVALAVHTLLFVALIAYFYPLFQHKKWYLRSDLSNFLETIPLLLIEYAVIVLFWYVLILWRRALDEGRQPWFFRMRSWSQVVIIVLLAIVTALVYYPFSEALIHAGPSKVGPEHPILQRVQDVMIFFIITYTSFLQSLIWLWWFNSAVRRVRVLILGAFSWFFFNSIVMVILEDAVQKNPFSDVVRHLHFSMVFNAKIGIAALVLFIVIDKIVLNYKTHRGRG